MANILVAGLINIETTLRIDSFPIDYQPVRYAFDAIQSSVSGVGFNIAKALTTLGHNVRLLSLIGDDAAGSLIRAVLDAEGIATEHVLPVLPATPQSVILYDASGQRMINTDLKSIQETPYPTDAITAMTWKNIDLAVLANINFSRPLLAAAKAAGIPIATDIHTISDIHDTYNADYMRAADILFMSDSGLPVAPDAWVEQLWSAYETPIIGIGMGAEGAYLALEDTRSTYTVPAQTVREVINTVGAGDALFSAFVHGYLVDENPMLAMKKAVLFASHKIGASSGSEGFLTAEQLNDLYAQSTFHS